MPQAPNDTNELRVEADAIRDIIRRESEEEGFPSFNLILEEDSTYVPAVYISFFVKSADSPTEAELDAVKRLRKRVGSALFNHKVSRVPYIRFRKAPERAE